MCRAGGPYCYDKWSASRKRFNSLRKKIKTWEKKGKEPTEEMRKEYADLLPVVDKEKETAYLLAKVGRGLVDIDKNLHKSMKIKRGDTRWVNRFKAIPSHHAESDNDFRYADGNWVSDHGINTHLYNHYATQSARQHQDHNYFRFERVDGDELESLSEMLPEKNMNDSHNGAPTFGQIAEAAYWHPITAEGYVVAGNREDQRVSLDGFTIDANRAGIKEGDDNDTAWGKAQNYLGLEGDFASPEEVRIRDGKVNFWWD